MFSLRGIFSTMVLMVGFLWGVIWITGSLPSVIESEHILTVEEASLIKKLSVPIAVDTSDPFNCEVNPSELSKINLAMRNKSDEATVVGLTDVDRALFVFWIAKKRSKCILTSIAAIPEPSLMEGHFQVNEWNRHQHLSVLFYDLEEKMIVHRAVSNPKSLYDALQDLQKFTDEIHEFQRDIVGAFDWVGSDVAT
jgi:hypothetical protein